MECKHDWYRQYGRIPDQPWAICRRCGLNANSEAHLQYYDLLEKIVTHSEVLRRLTARQQSVDVFERALYDAIGPYLQAIHPDRDPNDPDTLRYDLFIAIYMADQAVAAQAGRSPILTFPLLAELTGSSTAYLERYYRGHVFSWRRQRGQSAP